MVKEVILVKKLSDKMRLANIIQFVNNEYTNNFSNN